MNFGSVRLQLTEQPFFNALNNILARSKIVCSQKKIQFWMIEKWFSAFWWIISVKCRQYFVNLMRFTTTSGKQRIYSSFYYICFTRSKIVFNFTKCNIHQHTMRASLVNVKLKWDFLWTLFCERGNCIQAAVKIEHMFWRINYDNPLYSCKRICFESKIGR